jgi:hypothetical protein
MDRFTPESRLYVLNGLRQILDTNREAEFLEGQVHILEETVYPYPGLAFDLARAIVETTCITICANLGEELDLNLSAGEKLHRTLCAVGAHPSLHPDADYKSVIGEITSGLFKVLNGVTFLRNKNGLASHGKDAFSRLGDIPQAETVAGATDVIVKYLIEAWLILMKPREKAVTIYEDFQEFNAYLDESVDTIKLFGNEYLASRALFDLDIEAYLSAFADWNGYRSSDD